MAAVRYYIYSCLHFLAHFHSWCDGFHGGVCFHLSQNQTPLSVIFRLQLKQVSASLVSEVLGIALRYWSCVQNRPAHRKKAELFRGFCFFFKATFFALSCGSVAWSVGWHFGSSTKLVAKRYNCIRSLPIFFSICTQFVWWLNLFIGFTLCECIARICFFLTNLGFFLNPEMHLLVYSFVSCCSVYFQLVVLHVVAVLVVVVLSFFFKCFHDYYIVINFLSVFLF